MSKKNKEILDKLSERVIGHTHAKKVLINLINRSKLRHYQKWGLLESDDLVSLSNCLLIGDSGTGKTFLVESLSEVMEFPLVKIDATELNPTGASGGLKKKDVVKKILDKVKESMELQPELYWSVDGTLDQVVVFVDEIDKLSQQLSSDWNQHVQANFLTLFENKGELSGITFIFAGAFAGLKKQEEEVALIAKKQGIGFYLAEEDEVDKIKKEAEDDLSQKIIKYGLLPELVGRMNHIVPLDELKEEDYKKILVEQMLPKVKKQLTYFGIENYKLSKSKVNELAKKAKHSGLGVRGLQTAVNKLIVDLEFDPESYGDSE